MVAADYSDGKLPRRATALQLRLPYRCLVVLLPLYAMLVVLAAWHWSGFQLDSYLADRRQQAEAMATSAAAPLQQRLDGMKQAAIALAAQPEIVAALGAVNLFRRHDGTQSVDRVICEGGQNAALTAKLRSAAQNSDVQVVALMDGFGDCQASGQPNAPRSLFGPRSASGNLYTDSLHVVRDGKGRPLGFTVTAPSRDAAGRPLGSVALYLDRNRLNSLVSGDSTAVALAFDGGENRMAHPWVQVTQPGAALMTKIALRGVRSHDIVASEEGWIVRAQHRLCNLAAVYASVTADPVGYRLGQFALVVMLALGLPLLGLMIVLLARRAVQLQGLPTA